MMKRALAKAGNRAGKTVRRVQWRDSGLECAVLVWSWLAQSERLLTVFFFRFGLFVWVVVCLVALSGGFWLNL